MICSIQKEYCYLSIGVFARYAEYDMFYTVDGFHRYLTMFARYAEYDMFYTLN